MGQTNYLKLKAFSTSGCITGITFYQYVNAVSGSDTGDNLFIIDKWSGNVSGSISGISTSAVRLSGSIVYATVEQTSSGSSSNTIITPSSFRDSIYGKNICIVQLNSSSSLIGGEINIVEIPTSLNGWELEEVNAFCAGSSTNGSPTFIIEKFPAGVSSLSDSYANSMLTNSIIIEQGKYDSSFSSEQPIISERYKTVTQGNKLRIKNIISGASVTYASVSLVFIKAT